MLCDICGKESPEELMGFVTFCTCCCRYACIYCWSDFDSVGVCPDCR